MNDDPLVRRIQERQRQRQAGAAEPAADPLVQRIEERARARRQATASVPSEPAPAPAPEGDPGEGFGGWLKRGLMETPAAVGRGFSEVGHRAAIGVTELVGADRAADALRSSRERNRKFYGESETGLGRTADIATQVLGESALFMAPGAAAGRAAKAAGGGGRLLRLLANPQGFKQRAARNLITGAPLDLAISQAGPEDSFAGGLAQLTGSERMQRVAEGPVSRGAFDVAAGFGMGTAIEEGLEALARQRAGRRAPQPSTIAQNPPGTASTAPAPPQPAPAPQAPPAPGGQPRTIRQRIADVVDPTRQKELDEAFRDPMTGLANQTAFERARPRLDADPEVEIAALDVRNLKGLNDIEGRDVADAFLADVGRVAREVAEQFGIPARNVFRAGGDELAIAAPRGKAEEIAREVVYRVGDRPIGSSGFTTGVRFGVGETWHAADAAAQAAKAAETGPRFRDVKEPVGVGAATEEVPVRVRERAAAAVEASSEDVGLARRRVETPEERAKWISDYKAERQRQVAEAAAIPVPENVRAQVEQAFDDWSSGRAYVDGAGNYRLLEPKPLGSSQSSKRLGVAPWNKAVKKLFPDSGVFHDAAEARKTSPGAPAAKAPELDPDELPSPLAVVHQASATLPDVGAFRRTAGGATEAPRPSAIITEVQQALRQAMGGFKVASGLQGHRGKGGGTLLGFLKTRQHVLRMANATDVRVFAHEVGHALQKLLVGKSAVGGIDNRSLQKALTKPALLELEQLAKGISDESLKEGWAEYWRRFIDNPAVLQQQAPNTHAWVTQRLDQFPTVKVALGKAQGDWKLFRDADPEARVAAHISREADPRNLAIKDWWTRFRTDVIDHLEPVRKATELVRSRAGLRGIQEEADTLARLVNGSMGQAQHFLEQGTLDFATLRKTGPSLKEILEPVSDNLEGFDHYITSRRAQELHARDVLTGFEPADVDDVVAKYDGTRKDFGDAFKRLQDYNGALLEYLRQAGVISDDALQLITDANKNYVPFQRVREGGSFGTLGSNFGHLFSPVKKIKGSGKDLISPLESIVKNTYAYAHLAAKQQVSQAIASWAGKEGMGEVIEGLVRPMRPTQFNLGEIERQLGSVFGSRDWGDLVKKANQRGIDPRAEVLAVFRPQEMFGKANVISVLRNGERSYFEVDPELWRAIEGLDKEHLSTLGKLGAKAANTLRAGATLAPEFLIRNPIRDQAMAMLQSEYGYKPFLDLGRGIAEILRKGDAYEQWIASGGQRAALLSLDRKTMQRHVRELTKAKGGVKNVLKDPLDHLRALSALMEDGTRVGEFIRARARLGTSKEGLQRAALASREISTDFARHGAKLATLRATTAFWNARIQSYDRLARAAKLNPRKFGALGLAGIALPSVLEYFANRDDTRYWEQPQWARDLFWFLYRTDDPSEEPIRIPKPFELGLVFGTFPQRVLEWADTQDPEGMRRFGIEALGGELGGLMPMPTAMGPLLENAVNYSFFLDRPIVSRSLERLRPELQAGGGTSEVAQLLGRWAPGRGVSPAKIDNLLYAYTGGLGRLATDIADVGIRAAQDAPAQPTPTTADIPGVRGLVARAPGLSSESVERLYRQRELAEEAAASLRYLERTGETELAAKLRQDPEQVRLREMRSRLNSAADQIAGLRAERDVIMRDPTMSAEEKRERLDDLELRAPVIARAAIRRELPSP